MNGDIGVAERLGREAKQILILIARKMQLREAKLHLLSEREAEAERKERDLIRKIRLLKGKEMMCKRKSASDREQLVLKSRQFQEMTWVAAEQLPIRALRMETAQLEMLAQQLRAEEARLLGELQGCVQVDAASVASLVAKATQLQKKFQLVGREQRRVSADAEAAVAQARRERAISELEESEDAEYCCQLEKAIQDMTLLRAEAELTRSVASSGAAAISLGDTRSSMGKARKAPQATSIALSGLSLQCTEADSMCDKLATALGKRASLYKGLASELLPQDEVTPEAD